MGTAYCRWIRQRFKQVDWYSPRSLLVYFPLFLYTNTHPNKPLAVRWDPHRENALHFNQSATLYATYYHLQILIHRPFIPSPRKPSPLAFPSLAICTNAARSCSHVVDACRRRGRLPLPQLQISAFTAGVVLLLNIWGAKKSGQFVDSEKQMSDVRKCMQALKCIEDQ